MRRPSATDSPGALLRANATRARVDAQDRREVERIAGGQMQNAGDLTALHIRSGAARCDASPELTVDVVWSGD